MKWKNWGDKVFKHRGQIPLLFLFLATVASYYWNYQLVAYENTKALFVVSSSLMVCSALFRSYTIGYAAQHSSGRNRSAQVAKNLNIKGAYSMVQNPLYFANALMWLAGALFSNQWFFVISVLCLIGFLLPIMIRHERYFLRSIFGDEFERWSRNTPIFFPNPLLFQSQKRSFQWIRLFATEYPTWISMCAGVMAIHSFGRYLTQGHCSFNTEHYVLCFCAVTIGIIGRFFKYIIVRKWLKMPI